MFFTFRLTIASNAKKTCGLDCKFNETKSAKLSVIEDLKEQMDMLRVKAEY